jgi:hypothetical protein
MEHKCKKTDLKTVEKCELNAEQIIKALECCDADNPNCGDCPCYDNHDYCWNLNKHAISLIKELTVENDAISERYVIQVVTAIELDKQVQKLTEENERLRADKDYWKNRAKESESEYDQAVKRGYNLGMIDSVKSFVERLDKHFCHDPAFLGVEQRLIMDIIDQIAKEMLEGENEN